MLKIGNVILPGNLVLSPMAGITDAPFRQVAREHGADYTISEMVTSDQNLWHTNKTKWRLSDKWQVFPKIIQIAGASVDVIANTAIKCEEIGADLVEINMGCPAKKVCNVLAGSALLQNEKLVSQILYKAASCVSIPVILKTRLGWDTENKNILTIAKIAEDSGIQSLTIHGRTRSDLYNGHATYDLIAKVKQIIKIPVFANGDITTPEIAKYVLDYTKADGLYIGRGAQGNPWVFKQIKQYLTTGDYNKSINIQELKSTITKHLTYIYEHYDEYMGCRIAKKHIKWYLQNPLLNLTTKPDFLSFSLLETIEEQLAFLYRLFI